MTALVEQTRRGMTSRLCRLRSSLFVVHKRNNATRHNDNGGVKEAFVEGCKG